MPKIACIGEVMIELAPHESATASKELKSVSFAGDTYNTAVTLARLGIDTGYLTRLGNDNYSAKIFNFLDQEGIDSSATEQCNVRQPGLYMIQNLEGGERIFHYWRDQSAAKQLLGSEHARANIANYLKACDWVYFSAISIAILSDEDKAHFFALIEAFKQQGGKVAYDSNFRPRLWSNLESAQSASLKAVSLSDLALLTLDDEAELWGSAGDALSEAKARYADFPETEIVFKRGADDVLIVKGKNEVSVPVKPIDKVVDTTAAGDTFNAGYLASHVQGGDATASAKLGSKCAGIIIQHRGGVIEKSIFLEQLESTD